MNKNQTVPRHWNTSLLAWFLLIINAVFLTELKSHYVSKTNYTLHLAAATAHARAHTGMPPLLELSFHQKIFSAFFKLKLNQSSLHIICFFFTLFSCTPSCLLCDCLTAVFICGHCAAASLGQFTLLSRSLTSQLLALPPFSKKVVGSIPDLGPSCVELHVLLGCVPIMHVICEKYCRNSAEVEADLKCNLAFRRICIASRLRVLILLCVLLLFFQPESQNFIDRRTVSINNTTI